MGASPIIVEFRKSRWRYHRPQTRG
jgi:hypothetical protein